MSGQAERLSAARQGWAVGPLLESGILRIEGKDRLDFLHRMSTQALKSLMPGSAVHAAFLTSKGHLVGEGMILAWPDACLFELEPAAAAATRDHLRKYALRDQVKIEELSAEMRVLPVLGPEASPRARARAGAAPLLDNPRRGAPAVDLILYPGEAAAFREALLAEGATPLEEGDLEALRILGGFARFGADMDSTTLPMEAGLTRSAIHFGKGCYLGQEVVVRATQRGRIQKGLVQLALPAGAGPGAPLLAGQEQVGQVTSAAETPEGRVGLGMLRRAHWTLGERLGTPAGEAVVRRVLVEEFSPVSRHAQERGGSRW